MKYVNGNLLDMAQSGEFDIIVQGCSCFNTMGSGIAGQIAKRFPKAYHIDLLTQSGDVNKLGKFTEAYINGKAMVSYGPGIRGLKQVNMNFTIINAYTQYGYDPKLKPLDYQAVHDVFTQIKMLYDMNPMATRRIGIPKIGAGLAGGDWTIIESIIDDIGFSDLTCVVYND